MQGNLARSATEAAARAGAARGAEIVLNLAPFRWKPSGGMPGCYLVVNRLEATQASGAEPPDAAALALCRAGARRTIVTLGERGCIVAAGRTCQSFPAVPARLVDSTAAGDTFCGLLAVAIARDAGIAESIAMAQAAAAITVSRAGAFASLPTARELADLRN